MNYTENEIKRLQEIIDESERMVFFGGAGVSTESGIPDFRSQDGLYHQQYAYPPETILSRTFFDENPEEFYRFYKDKMLITGVQPNPAHLKLAEWEQQGKLSAIVTQNIDGLHQKAGSKKVFEVHGSVMKNHCMHCGAYYPMKYIRQSKGVPKCEMCGGTVKPDVVLYEEPLNDKTVNGAVRAIAEADTLIIGGTSLVVYPAAGFVDFFKGKNLVVINKTALNTGMGATLSISAPIGEVFAKLK